MRRRTLLGGLSALPMAGWSRASHAAPGYPRLMQGPMLGTVTDTAATVWARASGAYPVVLELGRRPDLADAAPVATAAASPDGDFVVKLTAAGLTPETTYFYRLLPDGKPDHYQGRLPPAALRTAPQPGARVPVRIGFGSCARIQAHPVQPVWDAIAARRPDLFLWLGDNVYLDSIEPAIMREEYRRQREVPNLAALQRTLPQLAIWDDHDFALNDSDRTNPAKDDALAVFRDYWANPAHGLPDIPGVFFKHSIGPVDLFMLDGRYHRDPNAAPDGPGKTMLGAGQRAWLERELTASRAMFKVLACGSGWSKAKGPGGDAWSSFLAERDSLFDVIRDAGVEGVVLISGDTHVGELNAIPRSEQGGYDLYDLVASPLAQDPITSWLDRRPELRMREVFVGGPNFGLIEVDPGEERLTYRLVTHRNTDAFAPFVVRAEELRNGRTSWPEKIDPISRARLEAQRQGRDYYTPPAERR